MNDSGHILFWWTHAGGCKAKQMYAVTPEFNSHLLTLVLPRDNTDPVSSSRNERCSITLDDLSLRFFSFIRLLSASDSQLFCSDILVSMCTQQYFMELNSRSTSPYDNCSYYNSKLT